MTTASQITVQACFDEGDWKHGLCCALAAYPNKLWPYYEYALFRYLFIH